MEEEKITKEENIAISNTKFDLLKLIGITISIIFVLISSIYFIKYQNDIKPLDINATFKDNRIRNVFVEYAKKDKQINIYVTESDNVIEDWQMEVFNKLNEKELATLKYKLKRNEVFEEQIYDWVRLDITEDNMLKISYSVGCNDIKAFVLYKQLVIENTNNQTMELFTPDIFSIDNKIKQKIKQEYLRQKEREAIAREARLFAETHAYMYSNKQAVPIKGINLRECLFEVNGVCFGHPFYAKEMSYTECKENKKQLGIKSCYDEDDGWASAVKICGGTKYLPTMEELDFLAMDLYEHLDNSSNNKRDNSKEYLKYFRKLLWTNRNPQSGFEESEIENIRFSLYSNEEKRYFKNISTAPLNFVMTRTFNLTETYRSEESKSYTLDNELSGNFDNPIEGTFLNIISICVAR